MSASQPFHPSYGTGQNLTAAAASANVTIPAGTKQIRVINTGMNPAQFRIGRGTQTATAADCHIVSGAVEVFTKAQDHDNFAYISALGTTLNICLGEGW